MSKSLDWIGLNQAKICYTQQFTLISQTLKDDHIHRKSTWLTNEIVTGRAFGTDCPPSVMCIWIKEVPESN